MFYKIINAIIRVVTYFIFPYKFYGKENMPQTGGALIVCNHKTFFDFLYITMSLKRPVALIAKQELFKNRFLAWLFDKYGAFPINRGGNDLGAVKKSIGLLRDGKAVLLFPEGTRNKGIKIGDVLGGAALIAAKAGVPLVPVYIKSREKPFSKQIVIMGKPFVLPETKRTDSAYLQLTADTIKEKLLELCIYDPQTGIMEEYKG